jgi:hypothetical protein
MATPVRDDEPGDRSVPTADHVSSGTTDGVEAFARQVGMEGVLQRSQTSGSGYRLGALPGPQRADPAKQRAWSALALVTDESALEGSGPSPLRSSPELIRWLTDPADATAAAFLALLTRLRQSRTAEPANVGKEGP